MTQTNAVVDALDDKFWSIVDGGAEGSTDLPIEQIDPKYNRKLRKGRGRDTARRKNRSGEKARRSENRPPKAVRKALRCKKRAERKKQRKLEKASATEQLVNTIEPEDQFFLREHRLETESWDYTDELDSEPEPMAPADPFNYDDVEMQLADLEEASAYLGTEFRIIQPA